MSLQSLTRLICVVVTETLGGRLDAEDLQYIKAGRDLMQK